MEKQEEQFTGLPENAFRELKEGEKYEPILSPKKSYPEVNLWSVLWGIGMAVLFSAAAAYLGLKVGQVFEAAIPIAIIAVGVSGAAKRKNSSRISAAERIAASGSAPIVTFPARRLPTPPAFAVIMLYR